MGGRKSVFTHEELDEYEELTYLTRKEILLAWEKWSSRLDRDHHNRNATMKPQDLESIEELRYNPFKDRITRVFSTGPGGELHFEDFLDILSVMSEKAPLQLKAHYAFHVFDMNEDAILDEEDLHLIVDRLTGTTNALQPEEKMKLVQSVLKETDLDGGGISEEEFKHLLTKCPDFIHAFRFTL
ncbi:calcium and integrin-binding protein 1-like isoform X2 [Oratosquilla oratoria]